jgi:hypothetical protein
VPALLITALIIAGLAGNVLRRTADVYILLVALLAVFLARNAYRGFWSGLERAGVRDARRRWQRQSPLLQRAVPPVIIAAVVILAAWAGGVPPDPSLLVLLAVTYVMYLLPRRVRRIALPLTVLGLAAAYPYFIQQTSYQRFLFTLPVFNVFPSMDTMVSMIIFAMMAIGLNMVVGYAGLLDLGYVAFYAIGAYTAAWLASPQFAGYHVDLARPADRWLADGFSRRHHRPTDAPSARGLPRDRDARLR